MKFKKRTYIYTNHPIFYTKKLMLLFTWGWVKKIRSCHGFLNPLDSNDDDNLRWSRCRTASGLATMMSRRSVRSCNLRSTLGPSQCLSKRLHPKQMVPKFIWKKKIHQKRDGSLKFIFLNNYHFVVYWVVVLNICYFHPYVGK